MWAVCRLTNTHVTTANLHYNTDDFEHQELSLNPRLHDTTCCPTGCQTGLTTGWTTVCIVYTNIQPVVQPVVSCKRGIRVHVQSSADAVDSEQTSSYNRSSLTLPPVNPTGRSLTLPLLWTHSRRPIDHEGPDGGN